MMTGAVAPVALVTPAVSSKHTASNAIPNDLHPVRPNQSLKIAHIKTPSSVLCHIILLGARDPILNPGRQVSHGNAMPPEIAAPSAVDRPRPWGANRDGASHPVAAMNARTEPGVRSSVRKPRCALQRGSAESRPRV
jgi:hypothetical protein